MGQGPPWPDFKALPLALAALLFSSTNQNPLKHRLHSTQHVLPHRPKVFLDSALTPGTQGVMGNRSLTLAYLPAPAPGVTQPAQPSLTLCHLLAASKPQNSLALTRSLSYSGACFHPQSSKRWHCSPKHRVSPSLLASRPNSHPACSLSTLPITPCHNGVCVTPCSVFPRPPKPP